MKIERILSTNLDLLMAAHPELNSQQRLSKISGVGQSTVGRVRRADVSATVDNVEALAKAFHLTPSQLLDPRLPEQLQKRKDPTAAEKAASLAEEIQRANLSEAQVAILANTLAAMRTQ